MFQKHNITRIIYTLCFASSPIYTRHNVSILIDCNVFLWPTCNIGDIPRSCRGWFPSTPYLLANSVTTSAPMHPGGCSLTLEQAPQNNHLVKQHRELLELCSFGRDRTAEVPYNPRLLGWQRTQAVVFCGHRLNDKLNSVADLPRSRKSRAAPGEGMSKELRVTPALAVPSSEPRGQPGGGHRVHPRSWMLQGDKPSPESDT